MVKSWIYVATPTSQPMHRLLCNKIRGFGRVGKSRYEREQLGHAVTVERILDKAHVSPQPSRGRWGKAGLE